MYPTLRRRTFLVKTSRAGMACCAMMFASRLAASPGSLSPGEEDKPDPKKLTYCGFECTEDCQFLKASLENDADLKREVYEAWNIKERYNIDFDAEKIFCFGCKPGDKPQGVVVENCTVRECTIEKGYDCCIECSELTGCEQDLWTRFPDFKNHVIELQKKYQAS